MNRWIKIILLLACMAGFFVCGGLCDRYVFRPPAPDYIAVSSLSLKDLALRRTEKDQDVFELYLLGRPQIDIPEFLRKFIAYIGRNNLIGFPTFSYNTEEGVYVSMHFDKQWLAKAKKFYESNNRWTKKGDGEYFMVDAGLKYDVSIYYRKLLVWDHGESGRVVFGCSISREERKN